MILTPSDHVPVYWSRWSSTSHRGVLPGDLGDHARTTLGDTTVPRRVVTHPQCDAGPRLVPCEMVATVNEAGQD